MVCVTYLSLSRLKTGNIPPDDLPFEETPCRTKEIIGTLPRKRSEQKKESDLFPKKKETEEKIFLTESEIQKGIPFNNILY